MGVMTEQYKKGLDEKALAKEAEARHARNVKHMEELAKLHPSPTTAEVQAAMAPRAPRVMEKVVEKVVEPETPGTYKTRDVKSSAVNKREKPED